VVVSSCFHVLITRALLKLSIVIPDGKQTKGTDIEVVLWLSYFYTSKELPIRLSFFWLALSLCDIMVNNFLLVVFM
jgi:hypothetical protein